MTDVVTIKLEGNEIVGTGACTLSGYAKVFAGYSLDRAEEQDKKDFLTRLIGKGSNKFFLDKYTISNLDDRDKSTGIDYNFRVADYFQKLGDEIYINLNLKKDYYNDFINKTRVSPKELEYRYDDEEKIELTIPEGYDVEYLPPDATLDGPVLGYNMAYKASGNKIILTKKVYINTLMINPDQFEEWNKTVKQISEAYKESIILKKKTK